VIFRVCFKSNISTLVEIFLLFDIKKILLGCTQYVVLIHEKMEKQKQSNQCRFSLTETDSCLSLSKLLDGLFFNLIIRRVNY